MKKQQSIWDNQLSITGDLNDFEVDFEEVTPERVTIKELEDMCIIEDEMTPFLFCV